MKHRAALVTAAALGFSLGVGTTLVVTGDATNPQTAAAPPAYPAGPVSVPAQAANPEQTVAAPPQPDRKAIRAARYSACVAKLPLDVRVGQSMLIITPSPWQVSRTLREGKAAGTLAAGNLTYSTAGGFRSVTSNTPYGAILAADEEGGLVQRYRGVTSLVPSASWQAANLSPEQVRARYRDHGRALKSWGVDMALAPVADVGHGPGITTRSYSSNPSVVATYTAAAAQGYRDAGLLPVLKHFPGHGRGTADSHTTASRVPGIESLRRLDLKPYREVLDDGPVGVLVAHVRIPGYSEEPSSLSRRVIKKLLRKEFGHKGLVISDGLGMAGTGTTQGQGLVRFLQAGGDLGIVTAGGAPWAHNAVKSALSRGDLSEQQLNSVAERVLRFKKVKACELVKGS